MRLSELLTQYEKQYLPTIIDVARSKSAMKHLLALDSEVTEIGYQQLLDYRVARKEAGVAEATINKELAVLGSVVRWANKAGLINHQISIPRVKEIPRATAVDESAVQKLINSAEDLRTKAFIFLLFATGQRKSSVQKLKRSQLINGIIEFDNDGYDKAHRRKRRAHTPVTKELSRVFDSLAKVFGSTEYVFPGRGGSGYCTSLDQWFAEAARASGVAISPHVLRHSACSVALAKGASLEEASKLLAHSSVQITERVYAHFQPGYIEPTVSTLGGLVTL